MNLRVSGFDWDDGNRSKCQKHGVSLTEIEALFARSPRIAPDPKHSAGEDRLIAVGRTTTGRPLFVAFHDTDQEQTPPHSTGDGPVYAR